MFAEVGCFLVDVRATGGVGGAEERGGAEGCGWAWGRSASEAVGSEALRVGA